MAVKFTGFPLRLGPCKATSSVTVHGGSVRLPEPVFRALEDGTLGGDREGAPVHSALQRIPDRHASRQPVNQAAGEGIPAPWCPPPTPAAPPPGSAPRREWPPPPPCLRSAPARPAARRRSGGRVARVVHLAEVGAGGHQHVAGATRLAALGILGPRSSCRASGACSR